ncbi:beta-lactamase class A [Arthrobacter sp. V1I9]|uniref:serine hydrolase n=1 Tax=Arthrobacter sp. V1I9 TaxID=3042275 RepID=UPI0027943FB7|nr:serine hydrolase [Arthrobacter sp. V1I9]MDQ0868245.1 beta-lactamase class A [Arthrobacter sp. V1I9]
MNTFRGADHAGIRHLRLGWHTTRRARLLAALAVAVLGTTTFAPAPPPFTTALAAPAAPAARNETLPSPAARKETRPSQSATATAKAAVPVTPPAPTVPAPAVTAVPGLQTDAAKLEVEINGIIGANSAYQLGVALIDTADGAVYQYGVREKFVAASTGKILAAAAYYHFAETGQLSLAAPLGGGTAAFQIQLMIQQSNNESWALIVGAIGYQRIHDYAALIGIAYDRTFNTLSPAETARTLSLLYNGQLISGEHTTQLLSYMQHTNYETLIPAAVPPGITVFHKYGLLNGNLHDASILVRNGHAYVFVVYTLGAGMGDIPARAAVIHQLTRAVVSNLF